MDKMTDVCVLQTIYEEAYVPQYVVRPMFNPLDYDTFEIKTKCYPIPTLIEEIIITLDVHTNNGYVALMELIDFIRQSHGEYNMELERVPVFDSLDYSLFDNKEAPGVATVTIKYGGIPYGFIKKYKKYIISLNLNTKQLSSVHNYSIGDSQNTFHYRIISIFPFVSRNFYYDKEISIPLNNILYTPSNRDVKKQARLESLDD